MTIPFIGLKDLEDSAAWNIDVDYKSLIQRLQISLTSRIVVNSGESKLGHDLQSPAEDSMQEPRARIERSGRIPRRSGKKSEPPGLESEKMFTPISRISFILLIIQSFLPTETHGIPPDCPLRS